MDGCPRDLLHAKLSLTSVQSSPAKQRLVAQRLAKGVTSWPGGKQCQHPRHHRPPQQHPHTLAVARCCQMWLNCLHHSLAAFDSRESCADCIACKKRCIQPTKINQVAKYLSGGKLYMLQNSHSWPTKGDPVEVFRTFPALVKRLRVCFIRDDQTHCC